MRDDTKSISTLFNDSSFDNPDITCFVKIISDTILFKSNFHQFVIKSNKTYNDLLYRATIDFVLLVTNQFESRD